VVIPLFFIGLLIVGMPLLVAREEWVFRRGAEERGTAMNLGRSVLFGLAHAVVGIPIGAALALSIGGVYLTLCYLDGWKETRSQTGALFESTRAHLAYNLTIITLVLVSLLALYATGNT
jgi:riboflavin transporter FmnP